MIATAHGTNVILKPGALEELYGRRQAAEVNMAAGKRVDGPVRGCGLSLPIGGSLYFWTRRSLATGKT
jgi:hypothetical protein